MSYCLRLPTGGSVSVTRTTAVRESERATLPSKASMCWGEKTFCGRTCIGTLRTTYLVDEEGVVEKIFTPKEIKTKIHAEQILAYIHDK